MSFCEEFFISLSEPLTLPSEAAGVGGVHLIKGLP